MVENDKKKNPIETYITPWTLLSGKGAENINKFVTGTGGIEL